MEELLTVEEASKFLGIHPKTLRRNYINKGLIPVVTLGSGPKGDRIRPSDVENLIRDRLCYINEETSGLSNSCSMANSSADPLGQPTRRKQKSANAKLGQKLHLN